MGRPLDIINTNDAKTKVSDVKVTGNPDVWHLVCKASSASGRWMKSTKAMQFPGGLLVQVTTKEGESVAEALAFVPGGRLEDLS